MTVLQAEYDELVDDLGEERDAAVQNIVNEVFELFAPMARREWLSWGGELLFTALQERVAREERELEAARVREEEEETRRVAEAAKKAKLDARKTALFEAKNAVLANFRAKALSKEDLRRRDAELKAEADAIKRAEAGEESEAEEELPVVVVAKRKATEVIDLEEDQEEDELEEDPKRTTGAEGGLLEVEGRVSLVVVLSSFVLNPGLRSATDVLASRANRDASWTRAHRSAGNVRTKRRGAIGAGFRGRGCARRAG